jgi:hypothetical protein
MSKMPLEDAYKQGAFQNEAIMQILAAVRRIEKLLEELREQLTK